MKILVVENNVRVYETYIARILTAGLNKAGIEPTLIHVSSMSDALVRLLDRDSYDVALIDFELGKAQTGETPQGKRELKNGASLIKWARADEKAAGMPAKPLIGMHNHPMARMYLLAAGAVTSFEKPAVAQMAGHLIVNIQ